MIRLLDRLLAATGRLLWHLRLAPLVRRLGARRPRIVLYHACEPIESAFTEGLGVNCTPDVFAAQLDHLVRHYRVVTLADIESSSPPPRAILITFDDGYRSVLEHAAPLLAARDLPAVVYLITGVVDNVDLVWVNELNWLLRRDPGAIAPLARAAFELDVDADCVAIMDAAVGGYDPDLVTRLLTDAWSAVEDDRDEVVAGLGLYLGWDDVEAMARRGFVFGSHSVTHPDLRRVDGDRAAWEVDESVAAVASALGTCTSFAFPFGFTDPERLALVESRELRSVMLVGSVHPQDPPVRRTRVSLTSADDAQIFAELEVVEPVKLLVRSFTRRVRPVPQTSLRSAG